MPANDFKIYINLDTLTAIQGVGVLTPVDRLFFVRGTQPTLDIVFLNGGVTPVQLPNNGTLDMRLAIKPLTGFDSQPYVYTEAFTQPTGMDTDYFVSPIFDSPQLSTDLGINTNNVYDKQYVDGWLQMWWGVLDAYPNKNVSILVRIFNDAVRGTETIPPPIPQYPPAADVVAVIQQALRWVTAPANSSDFSMFPGSVHPTQYEWAAMDNQYFYSFNSATDTQWRRSWRAIF